MKTFSIAFGGGISCTVQTPDQQPSANSRLIQNTVWRGPSVSNLPKAKRQKIWRTYVAWINSINTQLANEWNTTILHVFLIGPDQCEPWEYVPGKPPRFLGRQKAPSPETLAKTSSPMGLINHPDGQRPYGHLGKLE